MESTQQILLIIISQARLTDAEGVLGEGEKERDFKFIPTTQTSYLGPLHLLFERPACQAQLLLMLCGIGQVLSTLGLS